MATTNETGGMDWQAKAVALNSLEPISLKLRSNNREWYVVQRVEVADNHFLSGNCGSGNTPQAAIESHWRWLVDEIADKPDHRVVLNAYQENRRAVRWNGFMWADVVEAEAA